MSGNGYGYYYPTSTQSYATNPTHNQNWTEWSYEQQQYNNSVRDVFQNNSSNHVNGPITDFSAQNRQTSYYHSNASHNNQHYQQKRFSTGVQPSWQRSNHNKRPFALESPEDDIELRSKTTKKRKRPLSKNIPKKNWTVEEANLALTVEKEYNKRYRNPSLIIKFPDQELNRDIVSRFHPGIENVHFQQPSTPRFCFVTLQESANPDTVISALNKIRFGEGYLVAEYKKDREEDQNVGPEDIDPCTLYVGNLAQEITKEDMDRTYPKRRRIDIGHAKKMKYTRYAFVSFKNVSDSIEAFKKTHSTQMYSKSLIVRFRRLHGTVGMPGEPKTQSPNKRTSNSTREISESTSETLEEESVMLDDGNCLHNALDTSVVKQEVSSDEEDGEKAISKDCESRFISGSLNIGFKEHRPLKEVKPEEINYYCEVSTKYKKSTQKSKIKTETTECPAVKSETTNEERSTDDEVSETLDDVNFTSLLDQLDQHSTQIESLRKWTP